MFKKFLSSKVLLSCLALSLLAGACGSDDGGTVQEIGASSGSGSGSGSGSASGSSSSSASASAPSGSSSASGYASASGSASAPSSVMETGDFGSDDGYAYASDVSSHRLVPADVCDINGLLPKDAAIDYDAIHAIYKDGVNSVKSDGSVRTIGGFAVGEGKKHGVDTYFGTATPLHDFVISAIEGTGEFEGEADLVRRQGIQKGIMNQIMVAWTVHEINAALAKGADGNFDPAKGAPHNWDEGWAFYAGSEPGCSAFATADKRGKDFGTLNDSGESVANANIRAAFNSGRDALVGGDLAGAQADADVIVKNLTVTYVQATMKYAKSVDSDIADGDMDKARVHQAEGYAFWRVLAPMLAGTDVDAAAINGVYQLSNQPAAGSHDTVTAALTPVLESLGITSEDLGSY